jgi:Asp-tRNA(Asn)/Glu-tRNA(Gln) amidotransferase A subunit family amidase
MCVRFAAPFGSAARARETLFRTGSRALNVPLPSPQPFSKFGLAGGANSGPAAAVVSRLAPVALGLDTTGDVRVPAALCGCVGFRPTQGRYSRAGTLSLSSTLDTIGVFARSVRDVQLVDAVLCSGRAAEERIGEVIAAPAPTVELTAEEAAMEGAVTGIQSGIRGFLARKRVESMKGAEGKAAAAAVQSAAEAAAEKAEATAKIQALARGRASRKHAAAVKSRATGANARLQAQVAADDAAATVGASDAKAAEAAEVAVLEAAAVVLAPVLNDDAALGSPTDGAAAATGRAAFVSDLKGVRIGVPRSKYYAGLEPSLSVVVETALTRLKRAGAVLVEVDFPADSQPIELAEDVTEPLLGFEAPRELSAYLFTHEGAPVPPPKKVLAEGEEPEPEPEEEVRLESAL